MQDSQPSLIARDHTLFGVCEALGEDFGFNPVFLRIPFAVLLLWNPVAVVATYAALGLLVAGSRWLAPNPRPAVQAETLAEHARQAAEQDTDPLAIAA